MGLQGNQRNDSMKHKFTNKAPRAPSKGAEGVLGKVDGALHLIIDTREQCPLKFPGDYVMASKGTVPVFDYALANDETHYSVERKSLPDFIQAVVLSKSWKRELAKITKAQDRLLPVVYVCEFAFSDIGKYDFMQFVSGNVTPQFVFRRVAELIYVYNVHVFFAGSREAAAYAVALILKRRHEALRTDK